MALDVTASCSTVEPLDEAFFKMITSNGLINKDGGVPGAANCVPEQEDKRDSRFCIELID
tara:strand:- start:403 stop:582 length:180 start_codon:yes stop_codon:yes gene_type:complete